MDIHHCNMCPRNCGVDRAKQLGFCQTDFRPHISEICVHKGEEPVLGGEKGVCNVFFSMCNLRCVYCQNYAISQQHRDKKEITGIQEAVDRIAFILCNEGISTVGFVSPSHQVFQMKAIIDLLHKRGFYPTIIYNTNAYDSVETLRELESYVDIYLPDYKYSDDALSVKLSSAPSYSSVALAAIKEMYYQKGSRLALNDDGIAESGLIIRHLVLPNQVENSINALKTIAYEISPNIHISLMSQYYPEYKALEMPELNRYITTEEYGRVCDAAEDIGLVKGWWQQLDSNKEYCPDFDKQGNPFEK
ncbi:MAG: 4Fe-4S cluster-binding domain-containing protein [Bacteroidales bacterium]|nr:4Fe-4S cluster-binding domain-containing protein [Bacteroidales bacterium]